MRLREWTTVRKTYVGAHIGERSGRRPTGGQLCPRRGGERLPGIGTLEGRILQKVVTDANVVPIFEMTFLGFSFGFRPEDGAHDVPDVLTVGIERRRINWIVDTDIAKFFDKVDLERMKGPVRRGIHWQKGLARGLMQSGFS